MSLQIAILKVLVSHPEGRATIAALNSDLSILNTSGPEWSDRLKRLAARAPGLDVFGQRLILRDSSGWQITPQGRAFLDWLESGAHPRMYPWPSLRRMPGPRRSERQRRGLAICPVSRRLVRHLLIELLMASAGRRPGRSRSARPLR